MAVNFEKLALASLIEKKIKPHELSTEDFTGRSPRFIFNLIKSYFQRFGETPSIDVIIASITQKIEEDKAKIYTGYVEGLPENIQDSTEYILEGLRKDKSIKVLDDKLETLVDLVGSRDTEGARKLLKELLEVTNDTVSTAEDAKNIEFSTDNIMMVDCFLQDVTNKLQGVVLVSARSGCVDKDTEYLSRTGWKKMNQYQDGEEVLQWRPDRSTDFVKPLRYIKQSASPMYHIINKYTDMVLSENHRFPYIVEGKLYEILVKDLISRRELSSFNREYPVTFKTPSNTKGVSLTDDEIRLMVAIIADGHFPKTSVRSGLCRFNLKKEHKKERLECLLDNADIPYRKRESTAEGYHTYHFYAPMNTKVFTEFWECNKEQLDIIADEVTYWDGAIDGRNGSKQFYTSIPENAEFIQYVFQVTQGTTASCLMWDRRGKPYKTGGKEYTRKSVEFNVRSTTFNTATLTGCEITTFIPEDGLEYCFEVPSSYLVLRRNGRIFVTGNCGKSIFALNQGLHSYKQGHDVLYFNLELSKNEMMARILSKELEVPFEDIYRDLSPDEVAYYNQKRAEIFSRPNKFKMVNCTVDDEFIEQTIRSEVLTGCDIVVIDYIQLTENSEFSEQWKFLQRFVKRLHQLSLELGITVITPVQINEIKDKQGNVTPELRGSKELEYSSSLWFHITQNEEEWKENLARLITIKSRHSLKQTYVMQTDFKHMQFRPTGLVF